MARISFSDILIAGAVIEKIQADIDAQKHSGNKRAALAVTITDILGTALPLIVRNNPSYAADVADLQKVIDDATTRWATPPPPPIPTGSPAPSV